MTATGGESGGKDQPTSIFEELAYPIGGSVYPYGIVARPAIHLPVLGLLPVVGLLSAAGAVVIAVQGEPVGDRHDPAAAVAMIFAGIALTLLGLVVGAGSEMFRQVRTTGWTRPTQREEVPPLEVGTLRGVGYLMAVGGVGTSIVAGVIVFAGWDLSPPATVACALVPALLILALVAWIWLRRRGGDAPR